MCNIHFKPFGNRTCVGGWKHGERFFFFCFFVKGVSRFLCVHMFVCFGRGLIDSFVESCFPVSDASLYIRV